MTHEDWYESMLMRNPVYAALTEDMRTAQERTRKMLDEEVPAVGGRLVTDDLGSAGDSNPETERTREGVE